MLKTVPEYKYPVNLLLLLLPSMSLLFSNSSKRYKIFLSSVEIRVSLFPCMALEWSNVWAELVHVWGGDAAILEKLLSSTIIKSKYISEIFVSHLCRLFNASAYDLPKALRWVVSFFFFFVLDLFWKSSYQYQNY